METRPLKVQRTPIPSGDELDLAEKTNDYSTTLATASAQLLPVNKARTAAWIVNDSAVIMYVALGRDAAIHRGIRLNAEGGAFEINKQNLFRGQINGISASGTGNYITVLELESRYAY